MTKIEEVARAIAEAEQQPDAWETYERSAVAAIRAMEFPTHDMLAVMYPVDTSDQALLAWRAALVIARGEGA